MSQSHPFSTDRPIVAKADDRLGRASFANALASAIATWRERDSIVVGVYGPWGVGKTSLKNLVLEQLRLDKDHPDVLEFNPWPYDDDALPRAFFTQLSGSIRRWDTGKAARKLAAWLRSYSAAVTVGEKVTRGLPAAVPAVLGLLGLVGLGSSALTGFLALPFLTTASALLILIAGALATSRAFSEALADMISRARVDPDIDVSELKERIAEKLKKRKRPVLVVMDDIDRLETADIRRLFTLVKTNGDFPNVIYLLLFQRDIVERALAKDDAQSGRSYLEKIVQVAVDVPQPLSEEIHKILFAGLNRVLGARLQGRAFDEVRWGNVFVSGLSGYFDSLRAVNRFLSTLEFHFSLLSATGTLEVDPVDLIAVETLRLFEPDVYSALRGAKQLITTRRVFAPARPHGSDAVSLPFDCHPHAGGRRGGVGSSSSAKGRRTLAS
jgi:predicted KAP-like P-loop ATPase